MRVCSLTTGTRSGQPAATAAKPADGCGRATRTATVGDVGSASPADEGHVADQITDQAMAPVVPPRA